MDRDLLAHLPIVLAVARRGSFAAAAAETGVSPSNVSHIVKQVEARLGISLFARTTRSVSLTEAGEMFLVTIGPALASIETGWEMLQSQKSGASGLLRINAPRITHDWVLKPIAERLAETYPDVTLEYFFDDGLTDIVADGFDAGVRLGRMVSQDMIVVRLADTFRTALVASPDYLKQHGVPASVNALTSHKCIQYRMTSAGNIYRWELQDGDTRISLHTDGSIIVNDMLQARTLAEAGLGICYTFLPLVKRQIEDGKLIEILPHSAIKEDGLSLYFPRREAMAPKLRVFIDAARAILKETPSRHG